MKIQKLFTAVSSNTMARLQVPFLRSISLRLVLLIVGIFSLVSTFSLAQEERRYNVERPKARAATETVKPKTTATQATKGVLTVLLDPIIPGKVMVESSAGRIEAEADENGRADFELRRGLVYNVKAISPGYIGAAGKSEPLKATATVRLKLTPQFATLRLQDLPSGAQVLIDDQMRATADSRGAVIIADLAPGDHQLLIRHPEYNDFPSSLKKLEAGDIVSFPQLPLVKVARLTVQTLPGASILIDGEVKGKAESNGTVIINYQLAAASDHTIAVELLGYETWSQRERLTPGARTIPVKLNPIVTSAGVSDAFDDLALWNKAPKWEIRSERFNNKINNKLLVTGPELGTLKNTLYRDFEVNFTVWLSDGKGAAWAIRLDKSGKNYYLFYLAGPNSQTPRKFYTYLVLDGQVTQVNTPTPVLADLNQKDYYTIDITVQGFTIKHEITSKTGEKNDLGFYTDTADTKTKLLYGTFGFRAFKDESFTIDDFAIRPTKESEK